MASESPLKSTCILQSCLNCGGSNTPLITAGPEILCSIVEASKCRGDGLHLDLELWSMIVSFDTDDFVLVLHLFVLEKLTCL